MEGTMKVCVLTGQRQLEWTEREIPQPAAGELQIKLEYVGICGSDLHFFDQGRLANWELDGPLALGHEPGGVVTAIGEGVTGFEIGDKVAIEPAVPCGKCEACRTGHYNLCPDVKMLAIPHERDGVFSEYCTHDATMCYKLPENMDTMEGGLLEPLTVGMHGTELSDAKLGETAIVLGCGCIGLCTIMSLKARGLTEIYAADVLDKRLEKALEVGSKMIDWGKEEASDDPDIKIGKGVSIIQQGSGLPGLDHSNAHILMLADGGFSVHSGAADIGTGLDTVMAKVVAEVLEVPLSQVTVMSGDTDHTPFDTGAYASSGTFFSGNAARLAAEDMKRKILQKAAEYLNEPIEDCVLEYPAKVKGKNGEISRRTFGSR